MNPSHVELLNGLLAEINDSLKLKLLHADSSATDVFQRRASLYLTKAFGDSSHYLKEIAAVRFYPTVSKMDKVENQQRRAQARWEGLRKLVTIIEVAIEDLELSAKSNAVGQHRVKESTGRKVFVVHGHDDGLKDTVARILTTLDLEAIILHEQPSKGRTLIEKFESNAEGVVFAVVLLTPDDMAHESGKDPKEAKPRPRQNVIFELGFFLGKLGRDRVAALYKGEGIDIPSDYSGVAFIPFDKGNWQGELVREMKACDIEIDANKLFGK